MNRSELITRVSAETGMSRGDVEKAVVSALDVITGTLTDGTKVSLLGFGTFQVRERAAREGRNPKTGAKINIPAKSHVHFSAGTRLNRAIND